MVENRQADPVEDEALQYFCELVESVGVKRFAMNIGLSTRQVNRIISGVQPNPVHRLIRCLQGAEPEIGDRVLDFVCQEMGGHFVRQEAISEASMNAVKESAEAIAAISDGQIDQKTVREIREAISALSGLIMSLREARDKER